MAPKTSIALGFFDGVHRAHRKIIRAAVEYGAEKGLVSAALTFDRPPAEVLLGTARLCLTDNLEKGRLISAMGAECVMLGTTPELLKMTGEEFVLEILIKKMAAGALFCGYNYSFGSDKLTAADLLAIGEKYGLHVGVLPQECSGGEPISSSRIRELLGEGDMEGAAALLGRPYSVTGIVEHGKRLGRTMGFPTLNIYPSADRSFIPRGVYATWAVFGGEKHMGVTNIGINPTVGDRNIRIETHLPNFSGNLYGQEVTTEFVRFIRPERKFASVNELFDQVAKDTKTVVDVLNCDSE